jgi:hypothetical protein
LGEFWSADRQVSEIVRNVTDAGKNHIFQEIYGLTNGTKHEHMIFIERKEKNMTEIIRDVAAFASMIMFIASLSVIVMCL